MLVFATIGTSWITDSFVASAHATKQWKLAAVYSRNQKTAHDFVAKYDDPTVLVYDSISHLVTNDSVQVVYIASPNSLHYEQAKICLRAGKHVILEKPATPTPSEYEELRALSIREGVFLLEALRHLHEANFQILARAVEKLGPIYGASFTYASRSSRFDNVLAGETPNIFSLDYAGGCLVDLGVYPIAAAVALFGKPNSQEYMPTIIRTGVDGGGFVVLRYKDFGVQINTSKIWTSARPSEIYGENGTLAFSDFNAIAKITYTDCKTKAVEERARAKPELNMQEEALEFARIITERDTGAADRLHAISLAVVEITGDLRQKNGIEFGKAR